MKKFLISESEKQRILGMHKRAIRKEWVLNEDVKDGTVMAQARDQSYIDGTQGDMTDIAFSVVGRPGQYYYKCTANFNSTPEQQVGAEKAGAIYDRDFNLKTVAELGITGDYMSEFRNACGSVYEILRKKRETFCPNPKNKTKPNFAWNCPQYTDEAIAAAAEQEKSAAAAAQTEKNKAEAEAKISATQAANLAASQKEIQQGDLIMAANGESFGTPFNKLYQELSDLVEGTSASNYEMGSQQDIEAKINQLQAMWSDPNLKGKDVAQSADPRYESYSIAKALKFIPKLIQTAKTKYPSMTATFVK